MFPDQSMTFPQPCCRPLRSNPLKKSSTIWSFLLDGSGTAALWFSALLKVCSLHTQRNVTNELSPPWTHLCSVQQASLQHDQTPRWLCEGLCCESRRLGEWRGFSLACRASSPPRPLCSREPGPSEMSEGGTWHGTLPSLTPLEKQWKITAVVKRGQLSNTGDRRDCFFHTLQRKKTSNVREPKAVLIPNFLLES